MNSSLQKIPGIGDIPILGLLFKSKAAQKNQTELVVMITPEILPNGSNGVTPNLPKMAEPFMAPIPQKKTIEMPPAPFRGGRGDDQDAAAAAGSPLAPSAPAVTAAAPAAPNAAPTAVGEDACAEEGGQQTRGRARRSRSEGAAEGDDGGEQAPGADRRRRTAQSRGSREASGRDRQSR
jgi:hypothetical protein